MGWILASKNFKASEYADYNKKIGLNKYKYLHELLGNLFECLPFDNKDFIDLVNSEQQYFFQYDGLNVFIDLKFGSQAELINTDKLDLDTRIKLHENKLQQYKKNIIQLKLF